jgi:hypothetical protein
VVVALGGVFGLAVVVTGFAVEGVEDEGVLG